MSRFQRSLLFVLFATFGFGLYGTPTRAESIPVILDTDIGSDIDDTWALAMLLGMPELDLKLIVTDYGNTPERTRLVAKILQRAGRTDIPIGMGIKTGDDPLPQKRWLGDFDLGAYPGKVHEDGVAALIDTIRAEPGIVTLIAIGPVPNIKEALRRDPQIATKVRIVCTGGRIYKGFENGGKPPGDWNVRADVASWQAMVAAPWMITTSPLDASAELALRDKSYATVADSKHPLARIVMENYKLWAYRDSRPKNASSALYDTAAVYLAYSEEYAQVETLKLIVDDRGHTLISEDGKKVRCQLGWKDRKAFDAFLVKTLTASPKNTTPPSPQVSAKPELVREVLAGKRQEARASWWGFDRVGREAESEFAEPNAGVQPPMELTPIDPLVEPGRSDSGLLIWVEDEHGKPVGAADDYTQAYKYRYYTTSDPDKQFAITPPTDHDPIDFELVGRYVAHLVETTDDRQKLREQLVGIFPGWMNAGEWNYQRNSLFSMAPLGISQLYADGDHATKARIWKQHQDYLRGLHHLMSTDSRVPQWYRDEVARLGLDARFHADTHGWPHQLYIRVARRLRGRYTITAHDVYNKTQVNDPIGLAQYGIDTYPSRRIWLRQNGRILVGIEGKMFIGGDRGPTNVPYPIPYRAITPQADECSNLLVPVCFSATHLGYASARMEPVFMICGESAGIAACRALAESTTVQEIDMAAYRRTLVKAGQKLTWDPASIGVGAH